MSIIKFIKSLFVNNTEPAGKVVEPKFTTESTKSSKKAPKKKVAKKKAKKKTAKKKAPTKKVVKKTPNLKTMTKKQLDEYGDSIGLKLDRRKTKQAMIDEITAKK